MPHSSLKARLVRATFAITAVTAVAFGIGVYFAFDAVEDELFDRHTEADLRTFIRHYEMYPELATLPRENFIVYVARDGDLSGVPPDLRALPEDVDELSRDGRAYDVIRKRSGATRFYFLLDETAVEAYEGALARGLIAVVLGLTALSFGLSWALGRRIIAPIEALAARVTELGTDSVQELQIPPGAPQDEVHVLASAIQAYQRRVRALLKRERDFSADVAHELRTPLAAVQGAAELLEQRGAADAGLQELVARVRRGTQRMSALIEGLLFLARDPESVTEQFETLDLGDHLNEQLEALRELRERRGIEVRLQVDRPGTVRAIPVVVRIVLGNLLKNALAHTDHPRVDVGLDGPRVRVEDYGPGIAADLQDVMFERYRRGVGAGSGFGIGLALVRRFCDQFGWPIWVQSTPGAGTRIEIEFVSAPSART